MSDYHQSLMDEAYARWNDENDLKNKNYNQFLAGLTQKHRFAVVLGNLNYQVCNGGWNQWVQNGYCTAYPIVVEALQAMETETAETVLEMLDTIKNDLREEVVYGECESEGFGGDYFHEELEGEHEEECPYCQGYGTVEEEDDDGEITECTCEECGGDGFTTEWIEPPTYNGLDNKFYEINEILMAEANEFLKNFN